MLVLKKIRLKLLIFYPKLLIANNLLHWSQVCCWITFPILCQVTGVLISLYFINGLLLDVGSVLRNCNLIWFIFLISFIYLFILGKSLWAIPYAVLSWFQEAFVLWDTYGFPLDLTQVGDMLHCIESMSSCILFFIY